MENIERIKQMIVEHREELRERFGVTGVGLFGSYVRGEQRPDSDLDVLVSMDESVSLLEWAGAANYLSSLLGIKVDLVPREDIRPELRQLILEEVVYL